MIETLKYENLKYFFVALVFSLPFWWGMNLFEKNLEDLFFWQEIIENPQIFIAQLNVRQFETQKIPKLPEDGPLAIQAESVVSVWIKPDGEEKILFEKEIEKVLPIASLAKLMTANVVLEYYPDLSQTIEISQEAVFQTEDFGDLKIGERLSVKDLLYIMLIESSNDAAFALTEIIGEEGFVGLMNLEAKFLGMENSYSVDSTGISSENRSSVKDLIILTKHLLERPLIWEILGEPEFDLYGPDGVFHHKLLNTNELLGEIPQTVGGKTGFLPEAKGCFLLVLKAPKNKGFLINVILGSENKFEEMKKLINSVINNQ
ncbi:D-alanyl-D-alanine carboxypeptidase [Patescibacteria group bacterium]|nr:D-alanyl-D-alanine carboxypeptidase [Patescibacteria group bacterium]